MKKALTYLKLAPPLAISIFSPLSVIVSCSDNWINDFNGVSVNQYFLKKPVFNATELGLSSQIEQAKWTIDNEWIVNHIDTIFFKERVIRNFRYIEYLNVEIHNQGLQVGINFMSRDGRVGPLLQFKIVGFTS